jgi:hypothetical protein
MASDISLDWAGDFVLTASGDISAVSAGNKVVQWVIRRFLTNAQRTDNLGRVTNIPDYIWHPAFGGNARQYVDSLYSKQNATALQQRFSQQASLVSGVAASPPSQVVIVQTATGITMDATVIIADGTVITAQGVKYV